MNSYIAVGSIRNPKEGGHGDGKLDDDSGILIFIKGGIVEESTAPDLINYRRGVNPNFPHDPTADQQFDEPQFESYRELGFLAGQAACCKTDKKDDAATRFKAIAEHYEGVIDDIGSVG